MEVYLRQLAFTFRFRHARQAAATWIRPARAFFLAGWLTLLLSSRGPGRRVRSEREAVPVSVSRDVS